MAEKRMVKLRSSDGEIFEVDEVVAVQSEMLKNFFELKEVQSLEISKENMMEVDGTDAPLEASFPLPEVSSKILAMVIEYCKYHVESQKKSEGGQASSENEVTSWDAHFVEANLADLYDLFLAANYLDIHSLMVLTTKHIYNAKMKGKTPEEIYKTFKLPNDFNPKELECQKRQNAWAYEEYEE